MRRRRIFLAPLLCVALGLTAGSAQAAEPTLYELPDATHAGRLVFAPDGALWFTGYHGSQHPGGEDSFIGTFTPAAGLTEFPLRPTRQAYGGLTVGSDGSVWVGGAGEQRAEIRLARIGRLTPTGTLSERMLGNRKGEVLSMATLGGDVWFSALRKIKGLNRGTIGRLAADGSGRIKEFWLPTGCFADSLAAGERAIWFTEDCLIVPGITHRQTAAISRIDEAGKITRHLVPDRVELLSITVGPQESVWFGAERYPTERPRVGRLGAAGKVDEFAVPDAAPLDSIAVGPEGRLWFPTTRGALVHDAVNSIGPAGDIGEPSCLDPACSLEADYLTTGPEGAVWFSAGRVSSQTGGGGTGIGEPAVIANEPGYIGRLNP